MMTIRTNETLMTAVLAAALSSAGVAGALAQAQQQMPMPDQDTCMMCKLMASQGVMWVMGLGSLLVLILVVLAIAALVKYVFFR